MDCPVRTGTRSRTDSRTWSGLTLATTFVGEERFPRYAAAVLIIALILFGMLVGAAAQLLLGRGGKGIDWTMAFVAGLVGSFVGGLLASLVSGDGIELRPSGIIGSVVGAVLVLDVHTDAELLQLEALPVHTDLVSHASGFLPSGALFFAQGSLLLSSLSAHVSLCSSTL